MQVRVALAVLIIVLTVGCSDQTADDGDGAPAALRVASFDFTESEVLAELYAQAAEAVGIPVVRLGPAGPREIVRPAMAAGHIDLVPEYAGTALLFSGASETPPTVEEAVDRLNEALDAAGLVALEPAAALDTNVFVVTERTAIRLGLTEISDLVGSGLDRIGGPAECPDRPLCLIGLEETYGLTFEEFVVQPTLSFTEEALRRREIDVGVMFSTSPEAEAFDLVVLNDDRNLQPPDNVVPLVRRDALERWGAALAVTLNRLSAELETSDLQDLNRRVAEGESIADVVAEWLAARQTPG